MEYTIKDAITQATIDSLGAELKSLINIKTNEELMWSGDPEFWGKSSPVLFPIVGELKGNEYTYKNKRYKMGRHGFARDNEFEVISYSENEVLFLFRSSLETLKVYPFEFKFFMKYTIKDGKLNIKYQVENIDRNSIYFSLGGHPAFSIPTNESIKLSDYYLEFEMYETASILSLEGQQISKRKQEFLINQKTIELSEEIFKDDALIFDDLESKIVSIKCKKNNKKITMYYEDFRYIAFWSKVGAPFICLEPWNGIADFVDASGKLEEKEGIIKLEPRKVYSINLGIKIEA